MKLCLSSDALPDAPPGVLDRACKRRALQGLELTLGVGHAHALDERICPLREDKEINGFVELETRIAWLRLPTRPPLSTLMTWANAAYQLETGLLLPDPVSTPLVARAALVHPTGPDTAQEAADWAREHDAYTAWTVQPARYTPDELRRTLERTAPTLAHVRLVGGGPEASNDEGTGVLMTELALRGYAGTIALVPSPGAALDRWSRWLLDERGWGCNTAALKRDP